MASDNSTVTYRDCPGFPGYRVGDDGSVWTRWTGGGPNSKMGEVWKPLKPCFVSSHGMVNLSGRTRLVHRLVLEAFVGPCPDGMEGCHFPDRDPKNNQLSNLRWDTHKANLADRIIHGTLLCGEKNPKCKLSAEQVRTIRKDYAAGVKQNHLAIRYHVTRQLIWRIVNRTCWAHLD